MRLISSLLLILCLAGCQRGGQNNTDAVRQGVIDHLVQAKFDMTKMDLKMDSVKFNGEQADASVAVTVKGQTGGPPMSFVYHLEHQNNKWVVVGLGKESGHGVAADPNVGGGANPHGGEMPPAMPGADPHGGKMPSPQDLPPATKK